MKQNSLKQYPKNRQRGSLVRIGFDFMTQRFLVEVGFSKQLGFLLNFLF